RRAPIHGEIFTVLGFDVEWVALELEPHDQFGPDRMSEPDRERRPEADLVRGTVRVTERLESGLNLEDLDLGVQKRAGGHPCRENQEETREASHEDQGFSVRPQAQGVLPQPGQPAAYLRAMASSRSTPTVFANVASQASTSANSSTRSSCEPPRRAEASS